MNGSAIILCMLLALPAMLLVGCDERSVVTATPSPAPPEVSTLEPTPTLAETEAASTPDVTPSVEAVEATATAEETPLEPQGVEERISFEPGATSATVENAVVSGTRDRYLLEAAAGQRLLASISALENNAEFEVLAPDGQALAATSTSEDGVREYALLQAGDYVIVVGPTRGNATYTLSVNIPAVETAEPTRIAFEPGMAGAIIEGELEAGARALYVLEAVEDQYMTVNVATPGEPVALGVRGEDGTEFVPLEAGETGVRIVALPATMDYFIELLATGAATTFQLDVGASPLADLPIRIELGAGGSVTVDGVLEVGGDLASYILFLSEGQTLSVQALPADAPLSVYLQSADGADFFFAVEGRLEATAPRTLDYLLTVSTPNAAGETEYVLEIAIDS